jgi:Iron/zinc purple acid phosphatase-like protein C
MLLIISNLLTAILRCFSFRSHRAGGRNCDAPFQNEIPESWVAVRDASMYGYGRLQIFNNTHAEWKWVPLSTSDLHDYNQVSGNETVHLASVDHDRVILENQYIVRRRRERRELEERLRSADRHLGYLI